MGKRATVIIAIALSLGLAGCTSTTDRAMANCVDYMYSTAISEYKNPPDQATKDGWAEWAPGVCEQQLRDEGEAAFIELWG